MAGSSFFNDYEWKYTVECNYYKKMIESSVIFKFLAGLHVEFDEVWVESLVSNIFLLSVKCSLKCAVRKAGGMLCSVVAASRYPNNQRCLG